jgi:phosphatidylglycerophosphate synthase
MATPASNPLISGQSAADVHTLDTAILLPSSSVCADDRPTQILNTGRVGPLTLVGGLPLFLRTVLTLQRAGITNFIILSGVEEESLKRLLNQDPRIVAVVRWMPVHEFPLDDPHTWEALGRDIRGNCVVIGANLVFSRGFVEQLRQQAQAEDGQRVLMTACPGDGPARRESAEMMVVPARLFQGEAWRSLSERHDAPLHLIRAHAAAEGRLNTVSINPDSSQWCRTVRIQADVRDAEWRLLQSPKGSYDGFIDTYFNRKVANGLTRLFVMAGWSPNAVTALSLLIGFTAAGFFAHGAYLAGVIGALLFQVSAIIDCCDGDVARLTFRESRFGEQLDLIGDNVVHMAMFAAIGWAAYVNEGGWLFLALALLAMIGNALSLWFVTRVKVRNDRQTGARPLQSARSEFLLKNMVSRDFSIVVLLFALLNLMSVFLWLAAIGSNVFWMVTAWLARTPSLRA